ncbi:IDEAL domain-containing protein [Bacillus pinisoli]|uniref:IDEAL domain-containing protein n=1 Tax=Bacillus pinisoli TaxID=2901866 RepID=UPI001FF177B4|nr:IDEAL domain-containing protein [Bacillus pinisoli]
MKEKNSYSDIRKNDTKHNHTNQTDVNIYVQMLLDDILFKSRIKKLIKEIDVALDQRDYSSFQRLSKEYKQLVQSST